MSFIQRAAQWLGIREDATAPAMLPGVIPGGSGGLTLANITADKALTLSTVFRAVQVVETSARQLSLTTERGGQPITAPSLVKSPSLTLSRSAFIGETVTSLGLNGNAFWKLYRAAPDGEVLHIEVLPAHEVYVGKDYATGEAIYSHKGKVLQPWEIRHLQYMRRAGMLRGLGPIQAAQADLKAAIDVRDYAANWFTDGDVPNGVLRTTQALTQKETEQWYKAWTRTGEYAPVEGSRGRTTRVLGNDVKYDPMLLSPADAQFLESQQFSTTQIARLFGMPASLMLAAVEGSSATYSNIEQDSIIFVRFTLMAYLREIEEAFSSLVARGQDVRFNIEVLLRADTKTRYEGHVMSLKWSDEDEIRAIEGLAPLTDEQRARLDARNKTATNTAKAANGN